MSIIACGILPGESPIPQTSRRGRITGMSMEQSNRAPVAFRQSCRAACYTVILMTSPIVAFFAIAAVIEFYDTLRMPAVCCLSAIAVLALVRWLKHRDVHRSDQLKRIDQSQLDDRVIGIHDEVRRL